MRPSDYGEDTRTVWEKAGWTRAPRNGYEWRRLKEGKSQPDERDRRWKKPYKCRKCGGKEHKVIYIDGRAARSCVPCRAENRRRTAKRAWQKKRTKEDHRRYRQELRSEDPVFIDGVTTVSMTWVRENMGRIRELVEHGTIIVEYFGEPAFNIVHWSKM